MPPKAKPHHDDKSETASVKERGGHAAKDNHHANGSKLRRVASSTGTNAKDASAVNGTPSAAAAAIAAAAAAAAAVAQQPTPPGLNWSSFDREMLHDYRREHNLDTPTAFTWSYHQIVLSRPGSIGLNSPTMARRREYKRQSKDQLSQAVRKHFNGIGVQENDVIVGFLHKVKNPGVTRPRRNPLKPHASPMP